MGALGQSLGGLVIFAEGLATGLGQACWTKSPLKKTAKQIGTDGSVLVTSFCKPQLMATQRCHLQKQLSLGHAPMSTH